MKKMKERNQFTKAQEKQLRLWFSEKMNCRWQDVVLAQSYIREDCSCFNYIDVGACKEDYSIMTVLRVAQNKTDRRKKLQLMD